MSSQERFQQSSLRLRGRLLARAVASEVSGRALRMDDGPKYVDPAMVRDAYESMRMDKYEKVALLSYLMEDGCERYGAMDGLDALACELLGRWL